jgi:hypothetical protein
MFLLHANLFAQILNHTLLLSTEPSGKTYQYETTRIHCSRLYLILSKQPFEILIARPPKPSKINKFQLVSDFLEITRNTPLPSLNQRSTCTQNTEIGVAFQNESCRIHAEQLSPFLPLYELDIPCWDNMDSSLLLKR